MMCARPSYLLGEVHRCWLNLQRSSIPDVDSGKIKPMVETVLPLSEARHAHELNETGHARGKIVLQVAELFRNWLAIRSGQTGVKGGQQSPVCLLRLSIMRQLLDLPTTSVAFTNSSPRCNIPVTRLLIPLLLGSQ